MWWHIIATIILSATVAHADCLDFASQRGFLPKSTDGLQGQLVLVDAPKKDDIKLYVLMEWKWCFLPLIDPGIPSSEFISDLHNDGLIKFTDRYEKKFKEWKCLGL